MNKPDVPPQRSFQVKPEAKVLSAPTGQLNSTNVSINQLIHQQQVKQQQNFNDLPRNPFHKDDVIRLWKMMAHTLKLGGQEQVYHVMIKRDPVQVDEITFLFEVDNAIQQSRLESGMDQILEFIRKEIQNYDLNFSISVSEHVEDDVKFLTGTDRFEKLARKIPTFTTSETVLIWTLTINHEKIFVFTCPSSFD